MQFFFSCKRVDAALLAGNAFFGLLGAFMADYFSAGLANGYSVSFRMIVAFHGVTPIKRFRFRTVVGSY